jgi:hypothetical protein
LFLSKFNNSGSNNSIMEPRHKVMLGVGLVLFAVFALFMDGGPTRAGKTAAKMFRGQPGGLGPLKTVWGESTESELKFAVVSDLDQLSKVDGSAKPKWRSIFKRATMKRFKAQDGSISYNVEWEPDTNLFGSLGEEGRGMELSELAAWHGKLMTFDDRTGVAFEITPELLVIPRHILMEGDGDQPKGQKNEWATVKDDKLYVGSFGKEYVNSGTYRRHPSQPLVDIFSTNPTHHRAHRWIH